MKRNARIGLLPLYLKLYDDVVPEIRRGFDPLLKTIGKGLTARGATVVCAPVCRVTAEVEAAVALFREQDVDCVMTVHLAYSPSLESAPVLAGTAWPLILLDTTMDAAFGRGVDPSRIMYNHGVHGVMDFASILRRRGRSFEIVAGHVRDPQVLARAADLAQGAVAARRFLGARALRVGPSFAGMGDFAVEAGALRRALGIRVDQADASDLVAAMKKVKPAAIAEEVARDRKAFRVQIDAALHRQVAHAGLGLRRLLAAHDYAGFSVNFQEFSARKQPPGMPFAEISTAMSRGLGYGGEGDILTACLCGALSTAFGDTTFTEIFCSDWKGDSLFLAHMGEINPDVAASRPCLVASESAFVGPRTATLVCGIRRGPAVFANIVPGPNNRFDLLVAPVEMLGDATNPKMRKGVRGWMRPLLPVAAFLEEYSRFGGTHHSVLVMGEHTEALTAFARFAGLGVRVIA